MKIRHVKIEHFRGIEHLDWSVTADLVCLIGPGDSTKTTILDAIALALSPTQFAGFNDGDFHNGDVDKPIVIEVTVTDPPFNLLSENRFGLDERGWSASKGVTDEPEEDGEVALTVQLRVEHDLEPIWSVIKQSGQEEGKLIGQADRAAFQLYRVGDDVDTHLGWGRGSALTRLTPPNMNTAPTLAAAQRAAREAVFEIETEVLDAAAGQAEAVATEIGVPEGAAFAVGLDPRPAAGPARLTLHRGKIPLSSAGLGTRRLAALAIQQANLGERSMIVIDEVEHGLEPHRLSHLLSTLRKSILPPEPQLGQALVTTHSSEVIVELLAAHLFVVRADNGLTSIQHVPDAFVEGDADPQAVVRAGAAALLARRVIVCEGKTEIGFLRSLAESWRASRGVPLAHLGVAYTDGGGASAPGRATGFVRLGYETALLVDSDVELKPSPDELAESGVRVIQWAGGLSLEERVLHDLPEDALAPFISLAIEVVGDDTSVLQSLGARLENNLTTHDPLAWVSPSTTLADIRGAIGRTAAAKGWFKDIDRGEQLGRFVVQLLDQMSDTDTRLRVTDLEEFAYGVAQPASNGATEDGVGSPVQ